MNLLRIIICLTCLQAVHGFAQSTLPDSALQLKLVEVSAPRNIIFGTGNRAETLDTTLLERYENRNLADILTNESQLFVKSYGLGSLATTSFRGAGSGHTAILWNGFNLQSPMNGLLDVSLVPSAFINNVKIQYGGSGALWGSGAVGGTVHLDNSAEFDKGITAGTSVSFGSFSDQQQQVSVEISKKRMVSSLRIFNHDAKNDFDFINVAQYGRPKQKQVNAELKEYGLLQENYVLLGKRQKLNTRFWFQDNDRNIPPYMTQNISVSKQRDIFYRSSAEWQYAGDKLLLQARAAYFHEYIYFDNSLIDVHNKSLSKVFIAEVEARFSLTKLDLLNVGINNTYSEAVTVDYIRNPRQNRYAAFASYKIHNKAGTLNAVLSGRQEMVEGKPVPFTSALSIDGRLLRYFFLRGNIAKHYRLPTFNDLYWAQGGNPDLKPESGWSEEVGIIHRHSVKKLAWELGATVFNRNIDNWIIWLPNQHGIWSPENVLRVWSRGLEYKLSTAYTSGRFKIALTGMYNYVLSTNREGTGSNDESIGKQLIYIPIQNAQGNLTISYKGTSITWNQLYTGYRYTSSDNRKYLKPYSVVNVHVSQSILLGSSRLKIYLQMNNILGETYQVLAFMAMPQMNYQGGISLYINQPNKSTNPKQQ